jgi:hypothetical protein
MGGKEKMKNATLWHPMYVILLYFAIMLLSVPAGIGLSYLGWIFVERRQCFFSVFAFLAAIAVMLGGLTGFWLTLIPGAL